MENQTPPPAPPPMQPGNNPYDFIMNPEKPVKKPLLPNSNGGLMGRLIVVGIGAVLLILVAVVVINLLGSGKKNLQQDYLSLVQDQAELVRVSQIGTQKAKTAGTKNLATTIEHSVSSQQNDVTSLAIKSGLKLDTKLIAAGKDTKTDDLLTQAEQTNQFDSIFTRIMQNKLQSYQAKLKKVMNQTSSNSAKTTLQKDYDDADLILQSLK